MSLRQRLLTAAGRAYAQALARSTRVLGQARGAVLRQRPEERLFRRRGRLGIITDAIENKQQLTFWYDNTTDDFAGQRLGDPYGVYQRGGQTYLLCWVTPPTASATPSTGPAVSTMCQKASRRYPTFASKSISASRSQGKGCSKRADGHGPAIDQDKQK